MNKPIFPVARKILTRFLLAGCAGAVAAAPAQACRAYFTPSERIAALSRHDLFAGALLVRVTEARYTQDASGDAHPWQASATIERVLRGPRRSGLILFSRGFGSSACDDGTPVPRRGDRWVLYLSRDHQGGVAVNLSYPLAVTLRRDPPVAPLIPLGR